MSVLHRFYYTSIAESEVNISELQKFASAIEKRHEFKQTKSTPSSLEFNVRKPTPKILEPKTSPGPQRTLHATRITVKSPEDSDRDSPPRGAEGGNSDRGAEGSNSDTEVGVFDVKMENGEGKSPERSYGAQGKKEEHKDGEKRSPERDTVDKQSPGHQSPEHALDSSTDSVPPSLESSIESSQTCTSSLESSSLSPPLDDSASSEKEGSDAVFESATTRTYPPAIVIPKAERTPPPRRTPLHAEVAGSHFDKNEPQLVAIRKIDSVRLSDSVRMLLLFCLSVCLSCLMCVHVDTYPYIKWSRKPSRNA